MAQFVTLDEKQKAMLLQGLRLIHKDMDTRKGKRYKVIGSYRDGEEVRLERVSRKDLDDLFDLIEWADRIECGEE